MGTSECPGNADSDVYLALGIKEPDKRIAETPRILSIIALLLQKYVQKNEMQLEALPNKETVTIFHGLTAPTISIQHYIDRIFKYSACSPSCFVVAYIYVERFIQQTDVILTSLNVHRLLITSVTVAAKFMDDAFFNNAYYARVGGISTRELNRLEMKLLFSLDFRLQVSVTTFESYCSRMQKEGSELQIERPVKACGFKESWSSKSDAACTPASAG